MKRPHVLIVLAACLALVAWAGAFAASMQAKPTAVAVVDVKQIFNQIKERNAIEADLRANGQTLKKQEKQRRNKIAEIKNALDVMVPGSENYQAKQEEYDRALIDLKAWVSYQQQKMGRDRTVQIEALYRKMRKTLGKVASERGYDVVLYKESTPDFQKVDPNRVSAALQMRKVLWSTDKIDLTSDVVTRMNNQYDASAE